MRFHDRADAGRRLAEKLGDYKNKNVIVYALPRGGVVLGYEIAKALNAPLDLVIARKIGHPRNPEYAVCAVTEDGARIRNEAEERSLDPDWFEEATKREIEEAKWRREVYLKGKEPPSAEGKTAIIVDDGVATGLTLRAAIEDLKKKKPKSVVVAIPVAPQDTANNIASEVDGLVTLEIPSVYLGAVGAYYDNFSQTTDEEVIELLEEF